MSIATKMARPASECVPFSSQFRNGPGVDAIVKNGHKRRLFHLWRSFVFISVHHILTLARKTQKTTALN